MAWILEEKCSTWNTFVERQSPEFSICGKFFYKKQAGIEHFTLVNPSGSITSIFHAIYSQRPTQHFAWPTFNCISIKLFNVGLSSTMSFNGEDEPSRYLGSTQHFAWPTSNCISIKLFNVGL
jgi:hypothetical protein